MIATELTPRRLAWLSWALALSGVVLSLLYLLGGDLLRSIIPVVAMIPLIPAVIYTSIHHDFPKQFVVGLAAIGSVYLLYGAVVELAPESYAEGVGSALDLAGNIMILALLTYIVQRRRGRFSQGDIYDGVIIALGAWLVTWITLVQPFLSDGGSFGVTRLLSAIELPVLVPIIALTVIFLFSADRPTPASWMFAATLTFNVVGDFVYKLEDARGLGDWAYTVANVLYVFAFSTGAAAFVHPTAGDLHAIRGRRPISLPGRVAATAAAIMLPVLVAIVVPAESTADRIVRALSAMLLLAGVGWRFFHSTNATIESQERLIVAARTDDLTELPNKAAILEQAEEIIETVWRTDRCPSLYLIDLDRFKNINDSLGHASGDEVICVIAERLQLAAESIGATLGRPSGDEFLVLDPTPNSPHQALAHAEVLHSVFKQPLSTKDGVVFVAASVGVASMPKGRPLPAEELFRHADIAMYRAKDSGRNCLALYNDSMQERVSKRMRVETELHGALERREFRLFHQPIVDVNSGRVAGFEALIRWLKADGTLVSPAEFVPIAEDTGLIREIGAWALLEALTQLKTWSSDRIVPEHTTVSVNVSPKQLADPHFTDTVAEALNRSGVPPHLLWLEVTESVMVENPELARSSLQRIRAMGVRIALDDFGTGYSSLSLLQQFPIQRIKIDRAFVNGIADSSHDRSLVRTIIGLGDSMGLDIVAEGVESVSQLKLLRHLDCAKAQGFLISHPVPAEAMRSTVAALESLAQWPEFAQLLGEAPLNRAPIAGS